MLRFFDFFTLLKILSLGKAKEKQAFLSLFPHFFVTLHLCFRDRFFPTGKKNSFILLD